ncbi:MAG: CHAD domain-containing protein, partial [Pseudomonadota bacterium]
SEFLHDFRVAVRRTRSVLSQIKGVLPPEAIEQFSPGFAWLGQITSEPRDLDVYLLGFDRYKASLPVIIRDDLDPLYDFIVLRRDQAYGALVSNLTSAKYRRLLREWKSFLERPLSGEADTPLAGVAIKELSDHRIWRVYKRVLREGRAITPDSPAVALHELRKTCKKLRYLMEFFQSLYGKSRIKGLIKTLKGFQESLGDFQDFAVQQKTLQQFSQEMMASRRTPASTLLAMGVLVQQLGRRSSLARGEFADRFEDFESAEHRAQFKRLFKDGGKEHDS